MQEEEFLHFGNKDFVEKMHKRYENGDRSIPVEWVRFFQGMELSSGETQDLPQTAKDVDVSKIVSYFKRKGHLFAATNSFNESEKFDINKMLDELSIGRGALKEKVSSSFLSLQNVTLQEVIDKLELIYCKNMGLEFSGTNHGEKELWLHQKFASKMDVCKEDTINAVKEIAKAKLLEDFIQKKFLGAKRFSLEGGESFISLMKSIFNESARSGYEEGYIAMAHRGRINTLCHIMEKPYKEIFSEFNANRFVDKPGLGDVKYHNGYKNKVQTYCGKEIYLEMPPNPSHLEAVDPVLSGIVRARLDDGIKNVMGILIHGDASIAGQGIVYECLQFDKIDGYSTKGNIHIVIDNQIGFTAHPHESRSTLYPTDIAKTFSFPVFHVDASSIEEVLFIAKLAVEYKQKFEEDVFIHFNCHRLYGHNEADEPMFTNPSLYKKIRERKDIYTQTKAQIIEKGVISKEEMDDYEKEVRQKLHEGLENVDAGIDKPFEDLLSFNGDCEKEIPVFEEVTSSISEAVYQKVSQVIASVPEGFAIHKKVVKLIEGRKKALEQKDDILLDFGTAELMAYGSLLEEGINIRLSGQDSKRGTFSHRHSVYVDQETDDKVYCPLKSLQNGTFSVYNSLLSEYGVMGFEYGYSLKSVNTQVIWEAQFGDFYNGASIIVDQYISSTKSKWNEESSLMLLLPHGMEGMGPEHSSARIERFLQLCARANMTIYNPSNASQVFHLIRSQAKTKQKRPLVVFTPKSQLRNTSAMAKDLMDGKLEKVLFKGDLNAKKVVFCSGKIVSELEKADTENKLAIIAIEQLYPFPSADVRAMLASLKNNEQYYYVQEEAKNQGAYLFARDYLQEIVGNKESLQYVGRKRLESTATGFSSVHKYEQEIIIKKVLEG